MLNIRAHGYQLALAALSSIGCSTTNQGHPSPTKADPETVLIRYHVQRGKEGELQAALGRAWRVYRSEGLVLAEPHVLVRQTEEGQRTLLVEVFTWVSHSAPDHAPDAVKSVWAEEQSLCEARDGHAGIEGGEVELLLPAGR
jgi:hypothetical protein